MRLNDYIDKRKKEEEAKNTPLPLSNSTDKLRTRSTAMTNFILSSNDVDPNKSISISSENMELARDLGEGVNYDTNFNTLARESEMRKAEQQSTAAKIGNAIAQSLISEIGLGTIQGFVDILAAPFELLEGDERDWNNPISARIQKWRDDFNKSVAPIYRKNPDSAWDVSDVGWWASNFPSVMSSLSLLLPSLGITKGVGAASKLFKAAKSADQATHLGKIMGYNRVSGFLGHQAAKVGRKLDISGWKSSVINAKRAQELGNNLSMAFLSRVAENSQEAREIYNTGIADAEERLNKMSDEEFTKFTDINPEYKGKSKKEIAADIARQSADSAFNNDMALMLFDVVQLYGIAGLGKLKPNMRANSNIRAALNEQLSSLEKAGANATKGALGDIKLPFKTRMKDFVKNNAKFIATESTEGIEEAWQGIQQQKGAERIKNKFEDIDSYKTLGDYISDPEITAQAFWGWLGGIMFGGGANVIAKAADKYQLKKDIKNKNLSETDIRRRKLGMDAARIQDIESWKGKYDELKKNITTITNGYLPDTHPASKNEDGSQRQLSAAEINYYKQQFIESFISDMAVEAASNGNAGLLYEWIEDPRLQQYLKDNGMDDYATITRSTFEQAVNDYTDSLEQIYNNVPNAKPGIVDTLARQMAKVKRNKAANEKLIAGLQDEYERLKAEQLAGDKDTWKDDYETYISIESQLHSIERGLTDLQELESSLNKFIQKIKAGEINADVDKFNSRTNVDSEIKAFKKEVADRIAYIENAIPFTGEQFVKNRDSIISSLHELRDSINAIDISNSRDTKTGEYNAFSKIAPFIEKMNDIRTQYSEVIEDYNRTNPSQQLFEAYKKLNQNKKDAYIADRQLAMSKKEIEDNINDIEAAYMFIAQNYNNEYRDIIKKHLEQAKDVDEAFSKLIAGQYEGNKDLEEAMDFYDIGRGSRLQVGLDLMSLVNTIKKQREENTKNNSVGTDANNRPKPAEEVVKENATLEQAKDVKETPAEEVIDTKDTIEQEEIDAGIISNQEEIERIKDQLQEDATEYKQQTIGIDDKYVSDGYIPTTYELQIANITSLLENYIKNQTGDSNIVKYFVALSRANDSAVDDAVNDIANEIFNRGDKIFANTIKEDISKLIIDAINKKVTFSKARLQRQGMFTSADENTVNLVRKMLASYVFVDVAETDGTQASSFRSFEDSDRFNLLEQVLDNYFKEKYNKKPEGKSIIDIEDFLKYVFDTLATNGQLNLETYQALCKYIEVLGQVVDGHKDAKNVQDRFIFNDPSNILNTYKTTRDTSTFIKKLLNKFAINTEIENASQIDRGFRFVIHRDLKNRTALLNLANKKLYCDLDNYGNVILCYNEGDTKVKVGFLGKVKKVGKDNTIYALTSENPFTINSQVEKIGKDEYRLKNDAIIRELITSEDPNVKKILNALSEYYILSGKLKPGTVSEAVRLSLIDHQKENYVEVLKTALGDGGDFISRFLDSIGANGVKTQISDILKDKDGNYRSIDTINSQELRNIFTKIATTITDILYYDSYKASFVQFQSANNTSSLLASLNKFAKNVYDNFALTSKIQDALEANSGKQITVEFNQIGTYNLNYDKSADVPIGNLKIVSTATAHPVVIFKGKKAITENGTDKFENKPGFADNTMGILLSSNGTNPMVAVLNRSSYFGDIQNSELTKAVRSHIENAIKEYYNEPADLNSYNKLLNTFTNLFKLGSAFKGYDLSIVNGGFTINRAVTRIVDGEPTTEWHPVVSFYKYRAKAVNEQDRNGNSVIKYYEINADGTTGKETLNPSISKFTVLYNHGKIVTKTITDKLLNSLTNDIFNGIRISDRFIENSVSGSRQDNDFVTFDKKGTGFTVKIGDFDRHYTNFSDFIVRNNLYSTTHIGRTARDMFNEMGRDEQLQAIDSGIRTKITITSDTEATADVKTFKEKLQEKYQEKLGNKRTVEAETNEVLELAGLSKEQIEAIEHLNEPFEEGYGIIPTKIKLNFNTRVDNQGRPVYGARKGDTITYYANAMDLVTKQGGSEFIRLLIHEQFHKNIASEGFLKGEVGTARVNHIIDIFDSFNKVIVANKDEQGFKDVYDWLYTQDGGWYNRYKGYKEGTILRDGKQVSKEESRTEFANEFLAEAFSNVGLLNALNAIDYNGTKVVNNSSEPTLLQKILNILVEFFHKIGASKRVELNPASYLQEIHNTLGSEVNFEEANPSFKGEMKESVAATPTEDVAPAEEEPSSPVKGEQQQEVVVPERFTSDEDKAQYIKGYNDTMNGQVDMEGNPTEAYIEGYMAASKDISASLDNSDYNSIAPENLSQFAGFTFNEPVPIVKDENLNTAGFTDTEENALNALTSNPKNNPLGVSIITDMEQFLERFPPQERTAIQAELDAGRLKYICR